MTTIRDILKFKDGRPVDVKFPIVLKDANGNETYFENSNGFWYRCEFDANGNVTYCENSNGFWYKREYDANGNETYCENSSGTKQGTPRSDKIKVTAEGKTIEISRESAKALGLVK